MTGESKTWIDSLLRCPKCLAVLHSGDVEMVCGNEECLYSHRKHGFPILHGQPVLIDFDSSIFTRESFVDSTSEIAPGASEASTRRHKTAKKMIRQVLRGRNKAAEQSAILFVEKIKQRATTQDQNPSVLIIGGGELGAGTNPLFADKNTNILETDVYSSGRTDVICDGHNLPFADESFDGVWIQAVLEHVLDPPQVVSEIYRVLKKNGVVFSGTPFMQQVHMQGFDFTRYTLSGHRWLFRRFSEVDSGVSGGAGLALIWSIRYFVRALGATDRLASILAAPFFWLRFFDRFGNRRAMADAASGVYFLGQKSDESLTPSDLLDYYDNFDSKA